MTKPSNPHGVRTMRDLLARCRLDEETGCMVVEAAKRKGTYILWLPALGKAVALPVVLAHLMGHPLQPGQRWVPICGNTGCCSPEHRFIGTRSDLMLILRPTLDPLHRARIAAAARVRDGCRFSHELRAEICDSNESAEDISARTGVEKTQVHRIRRGEAWRLAAPTASVFNLGAARLPLP